ncbi:MAG: hypothetical protein ACE5ES_02255 [Candidatus Nanoarchaeia archaeon]
MDNIAGVHFAFRTIIIDLPKGETKEVDGIPVRQNARSFIAIEDDPFFLRVHNSAYVNIFRNPHSEMLLNYRGKYASYENCEGPDGVIHMVGKKYWRHEPLVRRSFYGLVGYEDMATPSDIIKGRGLMAHEAEIVTDDDSALVMVMGEVFKRHLGYYLSWPIFKTFESVDSHSIGEICRSESMSSREKSANLFNMLGNELPQLK